MFILPFIFIGLEFWLANYSSIDENFEIKAFKNKVKYLIIEQTIHWV